MEAITNFFIKKGLKKKTKKDSVEGKAIRIINLQTLSTDYFYFYFRDTIGSHINFKFCFQLYLANFTKTFNCNIKKNQTKILLEKAQPLSSSIK
jgi:hypothetical protein